MAATTSVASSLVLKSSPASLSSARSSINGSAVAAPQQVAVARNGNMTCRAENSEEVAAVSRRAALTLFAGAAALTLRANPAEAAYGEAANVFGKRGNTTGFIPYSGEGFSLSVPSKWNPSKEVEFPGTVARFEDNFDAVNNLSVIISPTPKSTITDFGSPEDFLSEVSYLLGRQSYAGLTASEGGFGKNVVASASVLSAEKKTVDGKDYYKISILARTADGNEGGTHQLITGAVSGGKLYILKIQAGDKRWFKGTKKFCEGAEESFLVA